MKPLVILVGSMETFLFRKMTTNLNWFTRVHTLCVKITRVRCQAFIVMSRLHLLPQLDGV
jgi:hypothetical protein